MTEADDGVADLLDLASKYEAIAVIGMGASGRVIRARHRELNELVAIKLLRNSATGDAKARFVREARAAARLRSRHVVRVMDAGLLSDGRPYIVMEHLAGQDLGRLVAGAGPLEPMRAVEFVLQSLEALAEAHANGIVHRDIKPSNLFAAEDACGDVSIKLVDFGLAKTISDRGTADVTLTEHGSVLGTPSYMAPEQFINAQDVDARADIWAIGATLFELLTGQPPFLGNTLHELYTAVVYAPIRRLRTVAPAADQALDAVIDRCLRRDRTERYANVAELACALAARQEGTEFGGYSARVERLLRGGRPRGRAEVRDASAEEVQPSQKGSAPDASRTQAETSNDGCVVPRRRHANAVFASGALLFLALAAWIVGRRPGSPEQQLPQPRSVVGVEHSTEPSISADSSVTGEAQDIAVTSGADASSSISAGPSPTTSLQGQRRTTRKPERKISKQQRKRSLVSSTPERENLMNAGDDVEARDRTSTAQDSDAIYRRFP